MRLIREKGFNCARPTEGHVSDESRFALFLRDGIPRVKRDADTVVMPSADCISHDLGLLQLMQLVQVQQHTHSMEPVPPIVSTIRTPTRYSTVGPFGGGGWCMWPLKWSFFFI